MLEYMNPAIFASFSFFALFARNNPGSIQEFSRKGAKGRKYSPSVLTLMAHPH